MNVKACPDCGKDKSADALWCVHCGSIKFWRIVTFMVSWAFASIPAAIIVGVIGFGFMLLYVGIPRH